MGDVNLGGATVLGGTLLLKRRGNWCMWVSDLSGTDAPTGTVSGSWLGTSFSGTVLRSGSADGKVSAVVVGGKGGGLKTLPSKMYDYSLPARLILSDALKDAGETLSTGGDQAAQQQALTTQIPRYVRAAGTLSEQLDQLVSALPAGTCWRVLLDGTVWVGVDAWQAAPAFDHTLSDTWAPASGMVPLLPEAVGVLPGQRYTGPGGNSGISMDAYVGDVAYRVEPDNATASIYRVDSRATGSDSQVSQMLRSVIREELRPTDFYRVFPGKVIQQRSDGSLDVMPDDDRLPPLTSVAVRVPIPGAKLTVPAGSRCDVVFENGNPAMPVAGTFGPGSGTRPITFKGAQVDVGTLLVTSVAMGVLSGSYTDPFGTVTTLATGTPIPLKGKIVEGFDGFQLPAS